MPAGNEFFGMHQDALRWVGKNERDFENENRNGARSQFQYPRSSNILFTIPNRLGRPNLLTLLRFLLSQLGPSIETTCFCR